MDSMSMFFNEYPSSDSTVTGIVTLLAAAKALWNLQETIESQAGAKDIMFTFLQGVIPRQLLFTCMYCRCCCVGWVWVRGCVAPAGDPSRAMPVPRTSCLPSSTG